MQIVEIQKQYLFVKLEEKLHLSSRRILPDVGNSKPAIILKVVVFPQPEGPRRTKNSPLWMVRSDSSTATKLSKVFLIFSI